MSVPPEHFHNVIGSLNVPLLQTKRVVVVGVGQVGSPIAEALANSGVGHLLLIDHDVLERRNLARHTLQVDDLEENKAESLTVKLDHEVENLHIEALPRRIDDLVSAGMLDQWLGDADLIVAATDDPDAQQRVAHRALMLGTPTVLPALYEGGGGEVFVQINRDYPCFNCFADFRNTAERLRGVSLTPFSAFPVLFTALTLCVAMLDPHAEAAELMTNGLGEPPTQLFRLNRFGVREPLPVRRQADCPSCAVGPSPLRPEIRQAWEAVRSRPQIGPNVQPLSSPRRVSPALPSPNTAGDFQSRLWAFIGSLLFAAAPFGVMALIAPVLNKHPNALLALIPIGCFIWLIAGIARVIESFKQLFDGRP